MRLDTKKWYLTLCTHRFFRFIAPQRGFPLGHFILFCALWSVHTPGLTAALLHARACTRRARSHAGLYPRASTVIPCIGTPPHQPRTASCTLRRPTSAPSCSVHPATSAPLHALSTPSSAPTPAACLARSPARPWFLVRLHHTSLLRGAPAFAVLGSAAHLRVLHRTQSRSPPVVCAPCARAGACSIHPLVLEHHSPLPGSPRWPTIRTPPHNCKPQRKPLRTPCTRPSYLRSTLHLVYSNSRTAPACTAHPAGALLRYELAHMLPALRARRLLASTFSPTHLFPRHHSTAHRARTSCTRRPSAPRWPTLTPPPHVHSPAAAAALARTSCVRTFVHARRAHTPLAPRPQSMRQDASRVQTLPCMGALHAVAPGHAALQRCGDPHAPDIVEPLVAQRQFGCRTPLDLIACALLERSLHPRALLLYHANKPHHHISHALSLVRVCTIGRNRAQRGWKIDGIECG
ncbi:hypothetical protein DFH08DRAFT_839323 [Mycena albidolilacea]|uniref:Uncharacterized protein n=1 Tax=Mycena albidolilacea TaxID=1033008 RepID=A0AAD7APD2_9AGAR|nr:hypothetical protein DFH08DRAFT_839323 [Mycena albidolilacea]